MPTIHLLEAEVSPEELVRAVDQLGMAELDRFVSQVLALHARRKAPALPENEAALLARINRGLPAELRDRLDELRDKLENETITAEEHAEHLRLVAAVEALDVERIQTLSELARIRGVSLTAVMDELGLKPPVHG